MPAWSGSTPIVWGDRIFLNVAVDDDDIELWRRDRDAGEAIWQRHLSDGNGRLRKQMWRADGVNPTRQRDYRIVASP